MTIFNLGSINADHVYSVPHLPLPGETLAATGFSIGLGGKGTNQSVAAARAGSDVFHIGAVGPDGVWAREKLAELGVNVDGVSQIQTPTGHAIINVDANAENAIVLFPGANVSLSESEISRALEAGKAGDTLLLQNETSHQAFAAELAQKKGIRVVYSAAPFSIEAVRAVLPFVSMLAMNEGEAAQLCAALGTNIENLPVPETLVTLGSKGAQWHGNGSNLNVESFSVVPVDTTGAGDTFAGYFAAARDQGADVAQALKLASAAAAIKVTRAGAAEAIPARAEVDVFLSQRS
ncbi:ribokinase [Falsihalocynthiibacter arcticus]|uniref:Ribokinase n=1 Tax=Falsihalocynthiibacter arcticus TaxID=1579316 RepID=A0A126UXV7_9RHOB|nr:ribokinase [Falsihalocynthiibacter arcticus]AML50880.1 ribokinase [Falsihalocynthiibacter arcticus]